ncbi:FAD-binding oxidoreductase [Lentzea sp. JNUCC 0626]|uniref:FAD-binding oxidoreductase n=1 Tax=Lentzea sp. JNUCC 0626 TaxID=3367513 RepID=UPI0037483B54
MAAPALDFTALAAELRGEVVLPADPGYDRAVQLQIAEYDAVAPACVAYCADEHDVAAGLRFARERGVPMRLRSGGHSFAGWSTTPGLVLDLSEMDHIGPVGTTVHLGPGVQSVDAMGALWPQGLVVPNGMCPTVAMGGFITGGGHGPQSRQHGLACDNLVSARVVLADGTVVRCSEAADPDLFWALRGGGGGNFGAVVDYEIVPRAIPSAVLFNLVWTAEAAVDVLCAWQDWVARAPDELSTSVSLVLPDGAEGVPVTVVLVGTFTGPVREAEALLADLVARCGSAPVHRLVLDQTYLDTMLWFYGGGQARPAHECHREGFRGGVLPRQQFQRERNQVFDRPLPEPVVAELVREFDAGREPGQTRFVNLTALGGQINRVARGATAYPHRDAHLLAGHVVLLPEAAPPPARELRAAAFAGAGFSLLHPHAAGSYVNFPDPALTDWRRAYWGDNHARLAEVKRHYDPDRLFQLPQGV